MPNLFKFCLHKVLPTVVFPHPNSPILEHSTSLYDHKNYYFEKKRKHFLDKIIFLARPKKKTFFFMGKHINQLTIMDSVSLPASVHTIKRDTFAKLSKDVI